MLTGQTVFRAFQTPFSPRATSRGMIAFAALLALSAQQSVLAHVAPSTAPLALQAQANTTMTHMGAMDKATQLMEQGRYAQVLPIWQAAVERDPVAAMLERNWLLPGSALFRAGTVGEDVFAGTPPFLEWTYIGLLLASRYRIALLPVPTVVHYEGHAFSMDRSRDCALGRPLAFAAMLRLDLPPAVKHRLRRKRGAAWHTASEVARLAGDPGAAWAAHLRSLAAPGGWRYATYTRYLLGLGRRRAVLAQRREHALADQPDGVRRVVVDAQRDLR